jgi:CubicO group peptidase (beta-lactamase class C family)
MIGIVRIVVVAAALITLAAPCPALAKEPKPHPSASIDPVQLAGLVDSVITAEMERERLPGAGFIFVQNGKVVWSRGYGFANLARRTRVSPDTTIWRIGSISKVFTATAVMQLADRGKIDLDAPVSRYVRRVAIPATYPEPVTVRHLLTHTAGFDEIRPGTQAETADSVLPLDRFLQGRLVRIRPPGRTIAYSTYGITLAGLLVEEVGGLPFETYLHRNLWEPLGMSRTSLNVPAPLKGDVAVGYEIEGDSLVPQPWEWYHTTPASSVNATLADMGRFMLAHLENGSLDGKRILSDKAAREMRRRQISMDDSIPGYGLGFNEDFVGLQRVLEHGGNMAGFSTLMVLVPEARAGFFVVSHREGSQLRDNLKQAFLERFFPASRKRHPVPALPSPARVDAERFAGEYGSLPSCWSCDPPRLWGKLQVQANEDGTLGFAGRRWVQVDSLRFVREDGTGYIVFRKDEKGSIHELHAGAYWGWQKLR